VDFLRLSYLVRMKFVAGLCLFALALNVVSSARVLIKSPPDPNAPLFEDTNFVFSKDIKDNKAPTVYTGDPRKASVTDAFNERTRDRFHNAYGTVNGIEVETVGKLKETNTGKAFVVSGSYSYTGADGRRYRVRYTADEFGYHPMTELELDFPDGSENNRLSRTQDPDDKLKRLQDRNRIDNDFNKNRNNNNNNRNNNRNNNPNDRNGASSGYQYEVPAERLYLPPVF